MPGKLGIADEMKDKARKIPATPVGEIVARGDAEIGFPADERIEAGGRHRHHRSLAGRVWQKIDGVLRKHRQRPSKEPDAGKALICSSPSPVAHVELVKSGMDPIATGTTNPVAGLIHRY